MSIPAEQANGGLDATRWDMEKQIFQMRLLTELAAEINSNDNVVTITKKALDIIMGTFGVLRGLIVLRNDELGIWRAIAHRGFDSLYVPLVGGRIYQRVESWRRTFIVVKPDMLPMTVRMVLRPEDFPGLYVPILADDEVLGFIYLGAMISGAQFDRKCIEIMNTAASFLSLIISNQKLFCQHLDQQQESFRIRGIFEQFYPPELVEKLLSKQEKLALGFTAKELTVLMADIRGYTSLTESSELNLIGELLNTYFASMTKVIVNNHGVVSKFMGDGIMAIFGDPVSYGNDVENSVRCALQMQEQFDSLAVEWQVKYQIPLGLGVGICTGQVLSGNFGCGQRIEHTVVGSPVNLAARLSGITNSGEIYIDALTTNSLGDCFQFRELSARKIKGFHEPVMVYRVDRV